MDGALILDGNKLSEKYAIKPYSYFQRRLQYYQQHTMRELDPQMLDESEEIILGDIKDIKKYIKGIIIIRKHIDFMMKQKQKEEPLDYVYEWFDNMTKALKLPWERGKGYLKHVNLNTIVEYFEDRDYKVQIV